MTERLMTDKEVAELLRISVYSLRQWRIKGKGPRCFKVGRNVRYRASDIDDYLANNKVDVKQ